VKPKIETLEKKLQEFADPTRVRTGQALELDILGKVERLFGDLQEVDAGPTSQIEAAAIAARQDAKSVMERWPTIPQEITSLNSALEAAGLEKITVP
jgi:hypothetical protein